MLPPISNPQDWWSFVCGRTLITSKVGGDSNEQKVQLLSYLENMNHKTLVRCLVWSFFLPCSQQLRNNMRSSPLIDSCVACFGHLHMGTCTEPSFECLHKYHLSCSRYNGVLLGTVAYIVIAIIWCKNMQGREPANDLQDSELYPTRWSILLHSMSCPSKKVVGYVSCHLHHLKASIRHNHWDNGSSTMMMYFILPWTALQWIYQEHPYNIWFR